MESKNKTKKNIQDNELPQWSVFINFFNTDFISLKGQNEIIDGSHKRNLFNQA